MQGFDIAKPMVKGLADFMERKGYTRTDDFVGLSLKRIRQDRMADFTWRGVAHVDQTKCNGCLLCVKSCQDAGTHPGSISLKKGKAVVDYDICAGCGLCGIVCPREAITYEKVPYTPCECR